MVRLPVLPFSMLASSCEKQARLQLAGEALQGRGAGPRAPQVRVLVVVLRLGVGQQPGAVQRVAAEGRVDRGVDQFGGLHRRQQADTGEPETGRERAFFHGHSSSLSKS